MAGHSHWKRVKHKKMAADAKRGKLFAKLSRLITVAAREGGGKPEMNPRLRLAIEKAKSSGMPAENIQRAIKKGTGELEAEKLEELVYEGYGPGGVAFLLECMSDNRNRTASEVRKTFELHGGKMGSSGCVAWLFQTKGLFLIDADTVDEDKLLEVALEAGADDVKRSDDMFEVTCEPSLFQQVKKALEQTRIAAVSAEVAKLPTTTVELDAETGKKVLRLIEALDELEDVQNVYANFSMPESAMAEVSSAS